MRRFTALLLLIPGLAFGWGAEGHRLVVRLADTLLSPAARARIQATLAPGESLAALASWADEVRPSRKETEPWHYVNIPLHSSGLDMQRDCPEGNCIIGKITEFRKTWRDPAVPAAQRREALLFLVHFVGDLHQPLHCTDNHDQGGNQVPVDFAGMPTKLHTLWDRVLISRMPPEEEWFARLSEAMPARAAESSGGTVEQWAGESFRLAQTVAYGLLPPPGEGGVEVLDQSYERAAQPVIELQLERAGARLAAILDQSGL